MSVLTTAAGGPEGLLRNYWKQQLQDILKNQLMAGDLMDVQVIPANSGRVCEFHRINSFSKQMTGVSTYHAGYARPNTSKVHVSPLKGRSFTVDSIVYDLELLTNDLHMDEIAIISAEPNPIPRLTELFLYNAKDTMDQRYINIMVSNTGNTQTSTVPSVSYFGSSVSSLTVWGDGSQTLTEATLDADIPSHRIAAETFNSAYTNLRSASAKFRAGGSGRKAYDCLISPEVAGDLRTDATFQDLALKGYHKGEDKFETAMLGEVFGVRVIEDENVSTGAAGTIDATNDQIIRCPVMGQGYVVRVSHAKGIGTPSVNYIPPGKADKMDPHGLVGIMTWKIYAAVGGVINPLAGNIIKVATTRSKSTTQDDDSTWSV